MKCEAGILVYVSNFDLICLETTGPGDKNIVKISKRD